ncbi:MAG: FHA domain-containing protein [Candidatus Accumulibacter sp.]|jgi:hypothetical protein|nr:FHA domain-containing protein [Accumulibacter sp.]
MSNKILVYAAVSGIADDGEYGANNPVKRRLTRIERVVTAYQGEIIDRSDRNLCAAFRSSDSALLAACEMQHRCSTLQQQFKRHAALRVGICLDTDEPGNAVDMASALAILDNGIIVSDDVVSRFNSELRLLVSPLKAPSIDIPVCSIDWRLEVPMGILCGDPPLDPDTLIESVEEIKPRSRSKSRESFLTLRYKEKEVLLTRDIPVITLGRDQQNNLVFENDFRVSRNHCRIEWRAGRVVLTDISTNGTSVTDENGKEVLIRKSSIDIRGRGLILLGRTFPGDLDCGVQFSTN